MEDRQNLTGLLKTKQNRASFAKSIHLPLTFINIFKNNLLNSKQG